MRFFVDLLSKRVLYAKMNENKKPHSSIKNSSKLLFGPQREPWPSPVAVGEPLPPCNNGMTGGEGQKWGSSSRREKKIEISTGPAAMGKRVDKCQYRVGLN